MSRTVSVLILSDNRLFRESLGRILTKRPDLRITCSLGLCDSAYEEALCLAPDVVVLDSIEFLYRVNAGKPRTPRNGLSMLMVAMEDNEQTFLRAIRMGAIGFVPKDASALDVVAAVRSVARGDAVCPPKFCRVLFDCVATQAGESPKSNCSLVLTRRERQLVPMIEQGLTNKEIAQQLNLSEQTIKNHIHRILHKVGAESRMGIMSAVHGFSN